MSEKSPIEWTETTWNPLTGCTKISPGCKHCYAERMALRLKAMGQANYRNGFDLTLHEQMLEQPLAWRKPRMVFVNSMSDLFHDDVPEEFIFRVFDVMRRAEQHTFQVLTKRSERLREMSPRIDWPANVWMGVSVERGDYVYRIDDLRATGAMTRFLSCEPLLGPLENLNLGNIHWVIVGGESGPGARRCRVEWVRQIVDKCRDKDVPCFVKQLGNYVVHKNDNIFSPFEVGMCWPDDTIVEDNINGFIENYQGADCRIKLRDRKGGDPDEWPADLRVRQMPMRGSRVAGIPGSTPGGCN